MIFDLEVMDVIKLPLPCDRSHELARMEREERKAIFEKRLVEALNLAGDLGYFLTKEVCLAVRDKLATPRGPLASRVHIATARLTGTHPAGFKTISEALFWWGEVCAITKLEHFLKYGHRTLKKKD